MQHQRHTRYVEADQPFKEREGDDERTLTSFDDNGNQLARASYRVDPAGAEIYTMSTSPDRRRHGHMTALIDEIARRHGAVTFDRTRTPAGSAFIASYQQRST